MRPSDPGSDGPPPDDGGLTPAAARRVVEDLERSGVGPSDWRAVVNLRVVLLAAAAREGDEGTFERELGALDGVRACCRREGWSTGSERREAWLRVRAHFRDGCIVLVRRGRHPSIRLLVRALRSALEDGAGAREAPILLQAAARQAVLAGSARRARRILRLLERDLASAGSVIGSSAEGIDRCIEATAALAARFGPEARRAALVTSLCGAWLASESASRAVEAVDPVVGAPPGGSGAERDAHALAQAVAAYAWHLLGDERESSRLSASARAALRGGARRRLKRIPACARSLLWIDTVGG